MAMFGIMANSPCWPKTRPLSRSRTVDDNTCGFGALGDRWRLLAPVATSQQLTDVTHVF